MNIGIIGAGHIGSALAVRLVSLGHSVYIANSRGPETLKDVAQKTGAKPVTAQEAARHGEIIVVTIPLKNIPDLPKDLFAGVAPDVPVIDTSNYYPMLRDGQMTELETGDLTESEWVQQHLDRPVVKAFNNIYADHLQNKGLPAGTPGRISLPVAGGDAAAKLKVMALVQELGFDAVDNGSLQRRGGSNQVPPPTAPTCPPTNCASISSVWAPNAPRLNTPSTWPTTPSRNRQWLRKATT